MKIEKVAIRKYRTFDKEVKIPLSQFTVLTGPNNLGKTTVLRALNVFFGAHQRYSLRSRVDRLDRYDFEKDYPKKYDGKRGRRHSSIIAVSISLSSDDIATIKSEIGCDLPASVTMTSEFIRDGSDIETKTTCDAGLDYESTRRFVRWFSDNCKYIYIPANRNVVDFRRSLFSELVASSIQGVRDSARRVRYLEKFYTDVRKEIAKLEADLGKELAQYLPAIKSVSLELEDLDVMSLVALEDVIVDDGARTSLNHKGDGVKSLFVMALLQYLAAKKQHRHLIFAIEEPESHLHSSAIYDAKTRLRSLSKSFQILISTHSPILIQRDAVSANIIIEPAGGVDFSCKAVPAKSLRAIRESLGIKRQENLAAADVTIVVEGASEENSLQYLLMAVSPTLKSAFEEGMVRVISAGGASKIMSIVRALARDAASCIVVIDSDNEGQDAYRKLVDSALLNIADIFQVPPRTECRETEYEDHFPAAVYLKEVAYSCGVSITEEEFEKERRASGNAKRKCAKWAAVMATLVDKRGKSWATCEATVKEAFAKALQANCGAASITSDVWLRSIADRVAVNVRENAQ